MGTKKYKKKYSRNRCNESITLSCLNFQCYFLEATHKMSHWFSVGILGMERCFFKACSLQDSLNTDVKSNTCDLVPFPTSRIVVKKLKFIFASGCCFSSSNRSKTVYLVSCVTFALLHLWNHTLKIKQPGKNRKILFLEKFIYVQNSVAKHALLMLLCVHLAQAEIRLFTSFPGKLDCGGDGQAYKRISKKMTF